MFLNWCACNAPAIESRKSESHCSSFCCGTFNHLGFIQTDTPPLNGHQRTWNGHETFRMTKSTSHITCQKSEISFEQFSNVCKQVTRYNNIFIRMHTVRMWNIQITDFLAHCAIRHKYNIMISNGWWLNKPFSMNTMINQNFQGVCTCMTLNFF